MNTSDNHILVYLDKSPFTIEIATKCVHLLNITRQGTQNQKENRRIFHHFMKKLVLDSTNLCYNQDKSNLSYVVLSVWL